MKKIQKCGIFVNIIFALSVVLSVGIFAFRLNMVAVINVAFMMICTLIIIFNLIASKKLNAKLLWAYSIPGISVSFYYIIFGADAGFGAFSNCLAGWKSAENILFAGEGNIGLRILGNILLILPCALIVSALFLLMKKSSTKERLSKASMFVLSITLVFTTVFYLLTMNLRSQPNTQRLWEGHNNYLSKTSKTKEDNPNVLVIMMDDLGYGDISLNGAIYDTPNIDSIGENGVNFNNFYSAYSVCSPSRFAMLTGRYPFRGYADNVIYPTVNSTSDFASTRLFNSIEMGANCDGMLGDEITLAEVFKSAGYSTGAFGKWHLGDYGEYLPTNQGFDYFYGSHHVNDMTPFYHVTEENGEYEIIHGSDELKDQSMATKWIHDEVSSWITETVKESDSPFFAYYATPWPHYPIFAGDDFDGITGMGTYVDCVTEFDFYLGQLFETMESLGVLDDTIIIFTSDNGPALEGSVNDLRGGKYLAYEGGQKVPFMIRWDNSNVSLEKGGVVSQSAAMVDLFPTLIELCGIKNGDGELHMPTDRIIDGVSLLPILTDENAVIHTDEHPILHMKREKIKGIQYTVTTESVLSRTEYADYKYSVLSENDNITFKYFKNIQNDNSAFFDKFRKNWLHILNDDVGENYNRASVYPTICNEMKEKMDKIMADFKVNRRGAL